MLPRLRRRRLWRRSLLVLSCLALFSLSVWLALVLAGYSPQRTVRVLPGGSRTAPRYAVDRENRTIRVRQPRGPGGEQEFEIQSTDQGILVRPAPGKR